VESKVVLNRRNTILMMSVIDFSLTTSHISICQAFHGTEDRPLFPIPNVVPLYNAVKSRFACLRTWEFFECGVLHLLPCWQFAALLQARDERSLKTVTTILSLRLRAKLHFS
jgi:hypothetical protein